MAVFFMAAASAQTRTVRGSVVDENDTPVIGATVIVKDSPTLGTSTDVNGEFVLKDLPAGGGGELQVSYVGYKTRTIAITPNVRIKLEPDAQAVEAVVVTGMTKTDKRLFTGASDQLVADDVKLSGMADISRGLEGRSAGVSVQNVSGTFGTAPKIRVRGATSIFGAVPNVPETFWKVSTSSKTVPPPRSTAHAPWRASSSSPPRKAVQASAASTTPVSSPTA